MTALDKTKKIIYIIAGTLTIMLLVFSLMKKIGLCAEAEYPLNYGTETKYGYNDEDFEQFISTYNFQALINHVESNHGWTNIDTIAIVEYNTNYVFLGLYNSNNYKIATDTPNYINNNPYIEGRNHVVRVQRDGQGNINYWYDQNNPQINISGNIDATTGLLKTNINIPNYPIWSTKTEIKASNYDITIFKHSKPHSKGGIIAEITENEEIASGELTQVDNDAPAQDTNAGWFQKILNAIKTFNNNYQAGLITITEAIQGNTEAQATMQVLLTELIIRTNELITANNPEEIAESWKRGWTESDAKLLEQSFQHAKGGIESAFTPLENDLILGNWTLRKQAGTLYLIGTIPYPEIFGGETRQYTFTFQWYEQIRNWFVPLITAFYTIALVLGFIKAVPSILQGAGTTIRNAEGAGHTKGGK